ncbi:penicillin-binding protein 1C [Vannielia litorea]|uniref:penicillin-binding protein 1C n=1 Tax=Vannielia litorea TaxID=1217970 RepID=UPI001C94BBBC|nr:penicillin-binding protein 1C [Vannielia litorea]MBY6049781.1 penicillin-binding protein 1C [Vannielia litorea]MBY6077195.1 penicillin-binding protein 1C [Vannielia litorea]
MWGERFIARLAVCAAVTLFALALGRDKLDAWVEATVLPPLVAEASPEVLARDGTLLRAYTVSDGRWRLYTTLGEVDPRYVDMLLAYEDKRFRTHPGVDWRATLRAVGQAVWNGKVISGGSTLSMQVARILEDGSTGQWQGKIRQVRLALAMERRLGKDAILELYLNRAPFGGNLEGVRAASLAYFGKEPRRLTPAEAALLVALPQSPERRRPDRANDAATGARGRVLDRMVGKGLLTAPEARAALRDPVPARRRDFPALAPHLSDHLLARNPIGTRHPTTIDKRLQQALEPLAAQTAREIGETISVAVVVADHQTGEILATVGSAGYLDDSRAGWVDMTRAFRSPGSALKPLVYGLAFDQGLAHPETLIEDRPMAFGSYAPQNFDNHYRGTIRLSEALRQSLNIPVVQLTEALTPERLLAHMRRAGMEPKLPQGRPGLAVALGGLGVTLTDLTQLYAAIARGGESIALSAAQSPHRAPARRVLSPEAAWQVTHILAQLTPPPRASHGPMAWKTGTSYGHRDAWAVGYDARHVVGVWIGRADGTPVPGAFGAGIAGPLLFASFDRLKDTREAFSPPPPSVLLVSNGELPQPLRHFASRSAALSTTAPGAPKLAYPPDGAELETGGALVVKLRDGRPPFTLLANGAPLATGLRAREAQFDWSAPGYLQLTVIDASGATARSSIRVLD